MAKITRQTLIPFGNAGPTADFGQFGSQAASAPVETKDLATIQALDAWKNGFQDAVALGEAPYLQDMNSALYVHSEELAYVFQEGTPEYDSGTTYYTGSIVKKAGTSQLFFSLADANVGNALPTAPASNAHWRYLMAGSGNQGLIIPGTASNDDAAAGQVGEYIRGYGAGVNAPGGGVFVNIATISLSAGDWDVNGLVEFTKSGATVTGSPTASISLYSGNTTTDQLVGDNTLSTTPLDAGTVPTGSSVTIAGYRISTATTITVYLKGAIGFSAGQPTLYGRISARRVR